MLSIGTKFLGICIICAFILYPINLRAIEKGISIQVDGKPVDCIDAPPYVNKDGRTMVPLRFVSEALGAEVIWLEDTKMVVIKKDIFKYTLKISDYKILASGYGRNLIKVMDTVPSLNNGRTFVPVRFVSELLGAKVDWDGDTQTVMITNNRGDLVLGGNPALPDNMYMPIGNDEISKVREGNDEPIMKQEYINKTTSLLNQINNVNYNNAPKEFKSFHFPLMAIGEMPISANFSNWVKCIEGNKIIKEVKFITDESKVVIQGRRGLGTDIYVQGKLQFIYREPTSERFLKTFGKGLEKEKWYTTDILVEYARQNRLNGYPGLSGIGLSQKWEALE